MVAGARRSGLAATSGSEKGQPGRIVGDYEESYQMPYRTAAVMPTGLNQPGFAPPAASEID